MAKTDTTSISLEELKVLSRALEQQKNSIYNAYKNDIVTVLETTKKCFSISGVDYSNIEQAFNSTFTNLNNGYEALIDVLNNKIIAQYSEVVNSLKQLFNSQFANQLNSILGIVNSKK